MKFKRLILLLLTCCLADLQLKAQITKEQVLDIVKQNGSKIAIGCSAIACTYLLKKIFFDKKSSELPASSDQTTTDSQAATEIPVQTDLQNQSDNQAVKEDIATPKNTVRVKKKRKKLAAYNFVNRHLSKINAVTCVAKSLKSQLLRNVNKIVKITKQKKRRKSNLPRDRNKFHYRDTQRR